MGAKGDSDDQLNSLNRYPGVNLYVKNIEDAIDDERFYQEFSKYGAITSAKIMRDDKGNSKGFGFVCYSSSNDATNALSEMSGRILVTKPLYVALAQRKEERRAQLSTLMMQRGASKQSNNIPPPQQPPGVYPIAQTGLPVASPPVVQPKLPPVNQVVTQIRSLPVIQPTNATGQSAAPGFYSPPNSQGAYALYTQPTQASNQMISPQWQPIRSSNYQHVGPVRWNMQPRFVLKTNANQNVYNSGLNGVQYIPYRNITYQVNSNGPVQYPNQDIMLSPQP